MQGLRGGLGRGLDALIPRGAGGMQEIEVDRIAPNPAQPRKGFDSTALDELAASIREHGLLQPVIVSRAPSGYTLIAGERRWRAAKLAGLATVPALVKDVSPLAALELALVENLQRADLSPIEEAAAYRELIDGHGITQEQVGARIGRSRVSVANRLRLLSLPPGARGLLADGQLSEGHARALLGCTDLVLLEALAARVAVEQLSVRSTEELVRRAVRGSETKPERAEPSGTEEELQRALGTRVQIVRSRRGGRLVIHYYDDDQLAGIVGSLLGQERL
ncbi:MAG: chromosome segregation DNA-binding protein [Chloroflexi bacterium]|nr:chromosome segregation DNA-binding protein [Chloroflexota bacterium]